MQRILEPSHLTRIGHAFVRANLQERLRQIGLLDSWCCQPSGVIAIAEPGKSIGDLEEGPRVASTHVTRLRMDRKTD